MIVTRWQAPLKPQLDQIKSLFLAEGLEPYEEVIEPNDQIPDHRHPFNEVRMVAEGQLLLNIAGNQLLLRPGDKIIIPANTKHSHKSNASENCICVCAKKAQ